MGPVPCEAWRKLCGNADDYRTAERFTPASAYETVLAHLQLIKEETVRQIATFAANMWKYMTPEKRVKNGLLLFSELCDRRQRSLLRAAKIPAGDLVGIHLETVMMQLKCCECNGDTLHHPRCRFNLLP